jgi:hypothetical protein
VRSRVVSLLDEAPPYVFSQQDRFSSFSGAVWVPMVSSSSFLLVYVLVGKYKMDEDTRQTT